MQGQRIYPKAQDDDLLKPGEYGIHPRAEFWYACAPNGLYCNLSNHQVTEHEDGTITVLPSILVTGYSYELSEDIAWHGYLERGVWREV